MPYISVHADLDEFDTGDLCSEVIDRIKSVRNRKLEKQQIQSLSKEFKPLFALFDTDHDAELPIKSLDDQMKMQFLKSVWKDFTCAQMEYLLNPHLLK